MVDAPALGRYMMDLTYQVKDNYELANKLSYLGEELTELGTPFSKRWDQYTTLDKKLIILCKEKMEKERTGS